MTRCARSSAICARATTTRPTSPTAPIRSPPSSFEDQAGYCQQFAGSMALMLRMVGIPSRVVSGFAPGSFDAERAALRGPRHRRALVGRGLLPRHRLGHLRSDPGRGARGLADAERRARARELLPRPRRGARTDTGSGARRSSADSRAERFRPVRAKTVGRGRRLPLVALGLTVADRGVGCGGLRAPAPGARRGHAGRRSARGAAARARTPRLERPERGHPAGDRAAVSASRSSRRRRVRRRSARSPLRARHPAPPGPGERRALRRALAAGGGLRGWLRGLIAIPPGGPADRTR